MERLTYSFWGKTGPVAWGSSRLEVNTSWDIQFRMRTYRQDNAWGVDSLRPNSSPCSFALSQCADVQLDLFQGPVDAFVLSKFRLGDLSVHWKRSRLLASAAAPRSGDRRFRVSGWPSGRKYGWFIPLNMLSASEHQNQVRWRAQPRRMPRALGTSSRGGCTAVMVLNSHYGSKCLAKVQGGAP